ncbi:hypothetical protein MKX01_021060 [Papaver californicum]|nr:hypothetical protein MKX01_021060 [Papaver californicum]
MEEENFGIHIRVAKNKIGPFDPLKVLIVSSANCSALQAGQPCFQPNNIQSHSSYAYNDYFRRMQSAGGTCDFGGTATTTSVDPSHGSCIFMGSYRSNSNRQFMRPAGKSGSKLHFSGITYMVLTALLALIQL